MRRATDVVSGRIPIAGSVIEATRPRLFVEPGTHAGASDLALCEAVGRLEAGTRCGAIDTWNRWRRTP